MKNNCLVSLFMCIFLCTVLAQDVSNQVKNGVCKLVCDSQIQSSQGLEILVNDTNNIIVIVNNTEPKVALVIDVKDKSYAFWNGSNGDTIIIDPASQSGVFLCPADSILIWDQYTKSVEEWLQTVPALKECALEASGGIHFNLSDIPAPILQTVSSILKRLTGGVPIPVSSSPKALSSVTKLITNLANSLNGPLKGILSQVQGSVPVGGGLQQTFGIFAALNEIFTKIEGGLQSLLQSGGSLDLEQLFKSANALDILTNILKQIAKVLNPATLLGAVFGSVTALLSLVASIAGVLFAIVGDLLNLVIQVLATVLGSVLGLVNLILGLGLDVVTLTSQLGLDILQVPIKLVNSILQLVPDELQKLVTSLFKNLFNTLAQIGQSTPQSSSIPGLDKASSCIESVA